MYKQRFVLSTYTMCIWYYWLRHCWRMQKRPPRWDQPKSTVAVCPFCIQLRRWARPDNGRTRPRILLPQFESIQHIVMHTQYAPASRPARSINKSRKPLPVRGSNEKAFVMARHSASTTRITIWSMLAERRFCAPRSCGILAVDD